MTWLEPFAACFGRRAQRLALRRYVQGLLSDSDRKSMEAMLARVTEPGSYQAFQHFITHAPWSAERVWRRLRAVLPSPRRSGDSRRHDLFKAGAPFGRRGAAYSGLQGQIVNCQAAVTAALWDGGRAYLVGATLYLPQAWATDAAARERAHVPSAVRFHEKWRLAMTLLRRVRPVASA